MDGVTGGHPLDQRGLARVGSVDDRVVAGLVDGDRVGGGEDAKIRHFRLSRVRIAVAVDAQAVGDVDVEHILRALVIDDRLAGVGHRFEEVVLLGELAKQLGGFGGDAGGVDVGLAGGGGDADADIFKRAAHAGHRVALKVGEHQHRVVVGKVLADDVLVQMKAVLDRNLDLAEFVHDVAGGHRLKTVFFDGLPVFLRVHAAALIGGAAFDDGAV